MKELTFRTKSDFDKWVAEGNELYAIYNIYGEYICDVEEPIFRFLLDAALIDADSRDLTRRINKDAVMCLATKVTIEEEESSISDEMKKAIQYVRDNKTWSDAEDDVALQYMGEQGCGLQFAFEKIYNQIYDLMEEYSADNDLPEGWWLYEKDVDEIFLDLK